MRTLRSAGTDVVGLDIAESPFTTEVGSVSDRDRVRQALRGVDGVIHTATLHKPHIESHTREDFVDTNVTGTLILLEEAKRAGVERFVFTSTTSVYGGALVPPPGEPAAWITEDVAPVPKNIYGVTKVAAENLCDLMHRDEGLACVVLRTSRFFPEPDDVADVRDVYDADNAKVNELLHRRADLADVVSAHVAALAAAESVRFGRYIVSATTPFGPSDLAGLRRDAPAVVRRLFPDYAEVYDRQRVEDVPGHRPGLRQYPGAR